MKFFSTILWGYEIFLDHFMGLWIFFLKDLWGYENFTPFSKRFTDRVPGIKKDPPLKDPKIQKDLKLGTSFPNFSAFLEYFWVLFGILSGSFLGIFLGCFWDVLGLFFGIFLGSVWDLFPFFPLHIKDFACEPASQPFYKTFIFNNLIHETFDKIKTNKKKRIKKY